MIYTIRHTYKPKIIIPYIGITGNHFTNLDFVLDKNERVVLTSDNVKCSVVNLEEKHLMELQNEIQNIYGCDAWAWLKRWYNIDGRLSDLRLLVLELVKV